MLKDELGELDEKHRQFVAICETCDPRAHLAVYGWVGNGCPPSSRLALCKAFIAKAVWDFSTTRDRAVSADGLATDLEVEPDPEYEQWLPACGRQVGEP